MAKSCWSQALALASLAGALAGCSTVPENQPPKLQASDLRLNTHHGNGRLVPRAEPPSRSGNPDTYRVGGRSYRVKETSEGYREQGLASWYGRRFHGRKTSSGLPYNMFDLTAAHKSLPIPTYVQVTNLENNRQVVVKVNDRGPFVGQRILDLSYAAAQQLDMLGRGTAHVEVVALQPYQALPALAARRAAAQARLASRSVEPKSQPQPQVASSAIQFTHKEPSQSVASALTTPTRDVSELTAVRTETESQAQAFTQPDWPIDTPAIRLSAQQPRPEPRSVIHSPAPRHNALASVKKTTPRPHAAPARPLVTAAPSPARARTVVASAPVQVKEPQPTATPLRVASAEQPAKTKTKVDARNDALTESKAAPTESKSGKSNSPVKAATGRNGTQLERPVSPIRRNLRAELKQVPSPTAHTLPSSALRVAGVKTGSSHLSTD